MGLYQAAHMELVQAIWDHPLYQSWYEKLKQAEESRLFCCHDITHLMDVARIAYIMNLEQDLGFKKETIYAAAFLHDIGKAAQYSDGIPHEQIGAEIADEILQSIAALEPSHGVPDEERAAIVAAVREHRRCPEGSSALGVLLYTADKASRACWACEMKTDCSWSEEKMNLSIQI